MVFDFRKRLVTTAVPGARRPAETRTTSLHYGCPLTLRGVALWESALPAPSCPSWL